ncbi:Z1 domain-containing protein [Rossellomorea marisflavi]|uniref:Z1 domain-containing protein n=1 Tax=Rossellomorea marisflavi TaxID=189381 RepID=UPI00345A9068
MKDLLKNKYFNQFKAQYNLIKSLNNTLSNEDVFTKTCSIMDSLFDENADDKQLENWKLELQIEYGEFTTIYKKKPIAFRIKEPEGWYKPNENNRFFWLRYQQYLVQKKNWDQNVIDTIDETTDEVLCSLGNPKNTAPFDVRGLVLGYVQSGKTANFTGLINKAFDVGYKVAIVLSGIHNDLRTQTQIRLEEEVIGHSNRGVGSIVKNDKNNFIHSLTTARHDITGTPSNPSYNLGGNKTLLVVKKNKDVLEHLIELLGNLIKQAGNINIPVIIIDDEADQASIDTSDKAKGEDPKTINRLIRETLMLFNQKAYVGYTATPFANLLIGTNNQTDQQGQDLYPKDFLIGLPKPGDYCGPDEFFNAAEDADDQRPSLVNFISGEDEELFKSIKKKEEHYKIDKVPSTLKEALMSFLIAISIRHLRGQESDHNSMLIHTSRFTLVQTSLKEVIEEEFLNLVNNVRYTPSSKDVYLIKTLYIREFRFKTSQWNKATKSSYKTFSWPEVYSKMKEIAKSISVMELNGDSEDALEYHKYKEEGLNVIAVGGDKLSRGLTLEGLSISYYYRNTLMYDTLMQMGRWFGYRKSYLDLCRIYTSEDIASNFEHLAVAMYSLRTEFEKMKNEKISPIDYAVRMLAHPKMMLTSNLKMRNVQTAFQNYSDQLHQTRLFSIEKDVYKKNMDSTVNLINKIHPFLQIHQPDKKNGRTQYHVASNVSVELIIEYLKNYKTYDSSTKSSTDSIINYIKVLNSEKYNELRIWKVIVVEGISNSSVPNQNADLGPLALSHTVIRGNSAKQRMFSDRVDVKAIVAGNQKNFDEEINTESVSVPKLFIYPLNPHTNAFSRVKGVGFNKDLIPIGFAIAFPRTPKSANEQIYLKNNTVIEK